MKKFENAFRINTVIPIALVDKAKRVAREQGIKVSELIRRACEKYCEDHIRAVASKKKTEVKDADTAIEVQAPVPTVGTQPE